MVEERAEYFGSKFAVDLCRGYLVDMPHSQAHKSILAKHFSTSVGVITKLTICCDLDLVCIYPNVTIKKKTRENIHVKFDLDQPVEYVDI